MISCIICSADVSMLENITESISLTIGSPFEVIGVDNREGRYSLCEAYNTGASRAKYDILVFVHEDVLFETDNWGSILADHFAKLPRAGIIGIAGSAYKSLSPSGWWAPADNYLSYYYKQSYKYSQGETILKAMNNDVIREMICMDGVFLAIKKDVFKKYRFDESLPFFHGYDLDFSLAVAGEFKNYFIPNILIHHLSEGKKDNTWFVNTFLLFKKWNMQLPLIVQGEENKRMETFIWQNYSRDVLLSALPFNQKVKILCHTLWVLSLRKKSFVHLYGLFRSLLFVGAKKLGYGGK